MTHEEILAKIERDYPDGTEILALGYDDEHKVIVKSHKYNEVKKDALGYWKYHIGYIYYKGDWAEIVEPVDENKPKIGRYITITDTASSKKVYVTKVMGYYGEKWLNDSPVLLLTETNYYRENKTVYTDDNRTWRYSTEAESDHLDACIIAGKYVDAPVDAPVDTNVFPAGSYVVLLASCDGKNCWGDMPINHCYKLSNHSSNRRFYVDKDINGSTTNGWWAGLGYDSKLKLRAATPEEIAEYDRLGKPFDVTMLGLLKEAAERYPIGAKYKVLGSSGREVGGIAESSCEPSYFDLDKGDVLIEIGRGFCYVNGKWADVEKSPLEICKEKYKAGMTIMSPLGSKTSLTETDVASTYLREDSGSVFTSKGGYQLYNKDKDQYAEILEEPKKSLVGRYLKVLDASHKDHYGIKNGDYLLFNKIGNDDDDEYEYWGEYPAKHYHGVDVHKSSDFELMPEGFDPSKIKKDVSKLKVGQWVKIINKPESGMRPEHWNFNGEMDHYFGQWVQVVSVNVQQSYDFGIENPWVLRHSDYTEVRDSKPETVRTWLDEQQEHHRRQQGRYNILMNERESLIQSTFPVPKPENIYTWRLQSSCESKEDIVSSHLILLDVKPVRVSKQFK